MIKLISKRRLAFRNPADGTFVTVLPQVFETVPDWAAKDPIFQWGVADGTIQTVDQTIVSGHKPAAESPEAAKATPGSEIPPVEPKKSAKKAGK